MLKLLITFLIAITLCKSYSQENSTFNICDKNNIYTVDNYLITSIVTEKIKNPKKSPEYSNNGLTGIKSSFEKKSIGTDDADNTVFRSHIAFIVNCNGETGDFQILSKNDSNIKPLEEKLLQIVKDNISSWTPAVYKGKNVDCYQVLVFTVLNGNITNVFYK